MLNFISMAALWGVFIATVGMGGWVLVPLDSAARRRTRSTRFTIVDIGGLIFLLQLPMAGLYHVVREDEALLVFVYALAWTASGLMWWCGVKTFSRAGIDATRTRAALVFFVLPVAYYGSVGMGVSGVGYVSSLVARDGRLATLSAAILVSLLAALVCAGVYTRWVVRRTMALEPPSDAHSDRSQTAIGAATPASSARSPAAGGQPQS